MDLSEIGAQAVRSWLVFYAVGLPFALLARRLGYTGFLPRMFVWSVLIPLVLCSAYAGVPYFFALLTFACLIACVELSRLASETAPPAPTARVRYFVVAALAAFPWMYWALVDTGFPWQLVPVAAAGSVLLYPGVGRPGESRRRSLSGRGTEARTLPPSVLGGTGALVGRAVGLGIGLACWVRILLLPSGFRFVLFAFSVVALNDIIASVSGKLLGGPKPFSRLSPHKTLSGFVGGSASGMLVAYICWFAVPELDFAQVTVAGLLVVVAGTAGDLFASGVKRHYGIKDFGSFMGPCGGMLDRLDSLLSSGLVFYLYLQYVT